MRETPCGQGDEGRDDADSEDSVKKLEESAKAHAAARQARAAEGAVKTGNATAEAATTAGPGEYVVQPGDTFTKIAKETGVSVQDLEAANPGVDSKKLKVGQVLKTK